MSLFKQIYNTYNSLNISSLSVVKGFLETICYLFLNCRHPITRSETNKLFIVSNYICKLMNPNLIKQAQARILYTNILEETASVTSHKTLEPLIRLKCKRLTSYTYQTVLNTRFIEKKNLLCTAKGKLTHLLSLLPSFPCKLALLSSAKEAFFILS